MIVLDDLLTGTHGSLVGDAQAQTFSDFAYDSRRAEPGQLFVAVKSDKGDGHDYIREAIAGGVTGVLCQRAPAGDLGVTTVLVSDTQVALRDYAAHIVRKSGVEVVAVTGSAGKTSTKEMIAAVLGTRYSVFKNYESYNGRYGLPIALARLEPEQRIAVLEMACDGFGEIAELARIAPPRVGVVTNVSENQIAYFGSLDAIAREDGALLEALPADGVAILNHDDPLVRALADCSQAPVVGFGVEPGPGLCASGIAATLEGTRFRMESAQGPADVALKFLGAHQVHNALAALAVGRHYEVPTEAAIEALGSLEPMPGRLQKLPGLHGSTVLDDTYSASPAPVLAALRFIGGLRRDITGRRIAVLGDLQNLGRFAEGCYREIGVLAASSLDLLVTVGEGAQRIADAARAEGMPAERSS